MRTRLEQSCLQSSWDSLMKEKNQDEEVFFPLELELDEILI